LSTERVTVRPPARVVVKRRGRELVEHIVTVRTGALVTHHRFPDARRADADTFVQRLVDEGAALVDDAR
jgi:hypothetical protein